MADFLAYSYVGIFLVIAATGCGLPLPEEVPIIAAGIAAGADKLDPWLTFAACLSGALVGDMAMYAIGRWMGRGFRRSRWLSKLINAKTEARTEAMIRRHGMKVFLVSRFLVGIRAPMYVSAGVLRVPFWRFLAIDSICATLVVSIVFGLSYLYGDQFKAAWETIHQSQQTLTLLIVIAALAALVAFFWWRRRKQDAMNGEDALPDDAENATDEALPDKSSKVSQT